MPDHALDELRSRLREAVALKRVTRAGWVRAGVEQPESVAAHSWGVAWLVLALCPPGVDRGRALAIAVLHDVAEVRIGDITPHDGVDKVDKHRRERRALVGLLEPLPQAESLEALWLEYEQASTPEGRFVRSCDKLDMALTAQLYASEGVDTDEFIVSALRALGDTDLAPLLG